MSQLTDSSAEHLLGVIAQMDNSEALTVERFGYLYPTARIASLERILSDQRFINAHNHYVHYDGHKEVPAKLRRFKWQLYNSKFTLLPTNCKVFKVKLSDRNRRKLIVSEIPGTDLVAERRAHKQASADASLIYVANMLRSQPLRPLRSIQKRKFGADLDIQGSSVNLRHIAENSAVYQTLETYFAAATVERNNTA